MGLQNILLAIASGLSFLIYYAAVIRGEEARLRSLHRGAFNDYCARVPRFWPKLAMPTRKDTLILNLVPFTRGLREVFWFPAAIILADALESAHVQHLWSAYTLPF